MTRSRPTADILQRVENLNGSDINNDLNWVDAVQAGQAAPVQNILAGTGIGVTVNPATKEYLITNLGGGGGSGVQSDWNETDVLSLAYIQNKPSDLNEFTNSPGYITAAQVPVQDIVGGSGISVSSNNGTYTVTSIVQQVQSDWSMTSASDPAYIKNKPTNVSEFANDSGYLTLSTAPVKDIQAGANTKVTNNNGVYTVSAIVDNVTSSQSDWLESDNQAISYIKNKPENLSDFSNDLGFVNATEAADAAPIQEIVAGTDISIVANPGKSFTINAITTPQVQSDWLEANTGSAAYIKNKPTNIAAELPVSSTDGTVVLDSPAANTYTISTAGTERVRVHSTGQVGIGRTIPATGPFFAIKAPISSVNASGCSVWTVIEAGATTSYGVYSAPEVTGTGTAYTTHVHYMAVGIPSMPSGSTLTNEWMFYANPTSQTDHPIVGFRSGLNDNGQAGTYAIHVAGTATSRFDSQLIVDGGLASEPAIAALGDTDTGISVPVADTFAISTDGTERVRVRGSGTVAFSQADSVPTSGSDSYGITQRFDVPHNGMLMNSVGYAAAGTNTAYGLWFQLNSNAPDGTAHTGTFTPIIIGATSVGTGTTIAQWRGIDIGDQSVPDKAYGIYTTMAPRAGKERYAIFADGTAPSRFDGQLLVPAGNENTPSIALIGDDTGISFATDIVTISTAGTERMRVDSAGKVAVGGNYPVQTLTVIQDFSVRDTAAQVFYATNTAANDLIATDYQRGSRVVGREGFAVDVATSGAEQTSYKVFTADGAGNLAEAASFGNSLATISTGGTERMRVQGDGRVSIGNPATQSSASLLIRKAQDSTSVIRMDGAAPTAAGAYYGVLSAPTMAGASISTYAHFTASESGSGDFAVSYGFLAGDSLSGTSSARGFMSSLSAGPSRWNIYAEGTASNYFAGQCQFGAGSALAPSITLAGDTDTGIFFGTDVVAISTVGTERMRVTATGQITAAAGYTPTNAQDLATKAYVDTNAGTLTNVPDGTPAAPAIAFAADQATGIFRETATNCWCVSVGGLKRFEIDTVGDCYTSGWLGIATPDDATAALDVNGESIRIRQSVTPASATATGEAGEIMWDADYLYVCVATNTWKRVALTSW
jgi:hypothetical protein